MQEIQELWALGAANKTLSRLLLGRMGNNDFSNVQLNVLFAVSTTLSIFSLFGSFLIVFSYYKFDKLRKFSFKLVSYMSIADTFSCIAFFFGNPADGSTLCSLQGFCIQLFQLSSILWTTAIATTLFRAVVKRAGSKELMMRFHGLCTGLPLLFAFLPLFTSSYGNTMAWCWIFVEEESPTIGQVWRLMLFYLPLWLAVGFNGYVYYISNRAMKSLFSNTAECVPKKYRNLMRRLNAYPLILAGCWFFATINRVQNAINPQGPLFWLYLLQVIGRSSQGFLNAIAYGLNDNVRQEWAILFGRHPNVVTNYWVEQFELRQRQRLEEDEEGIAHTESDDSSDEDEDDDELETYSETRRNKPEQDQDDLETTII